MVRFRSAVVGRAPEPPQTRSRHGRPRQSADETKNAAETQNGPAFNQQDFDVYNRSSGAAWSSAARAYFRKGEADLPRRGSFRHQGTQVVTAGRAAFSGRGRGPPPGRGRRSGRGPDGKTCTPRHRRWPIAAPGPHEGTTHIVRRALRAPWPTIPQRLAYALIAWIPLAAVIAAGFASSTQFALASALMAASLVLLVALPRIAYIAAVATVLVLIIGGLFVGGALSQGLRRRLIGLRSMSASCCWSATQALRLLWSLGHRACAPGRRSERSSQHRAKPNGSAAHRNRAHRALQLSVREAHGRHIHPAPRGYGRGPIDARLRARHPRPAALAGHGVGRGSRGRRPAREGAVRSVSPDAAPRALPRSRRPVPARRTRPTTATARQRSSTRIARRRKPRTSRRITWVGART